jgi:hypothetical protein
LSDDLIDIELEIKDGSTSGIAMMSFKTEEKAEEAAEALDRFQFTKYTLTALTAKKFDEIFSLK